MENPNFESDETSTDGPASIPANGSSQRLDMSEERKSNPGSFRFGNGFNNHITPLETGSNKPTPFVPPYDDGALVEVIPPTQKEQKEQKDDKAKKKPMVGIFEVFRFSDTKDILLMIVGTLAACAQGACLPALVVIFGQMTDIFVDTGYISSILPQFQSCHDGITVDWVTNHMDEFSACLTAMNRTDVLQTIQKNASDGVLTKMRGIALYFVYIGIAVIILGYIQMVGWQTASFNQSQRIRRVLLGSILKQDIGWFDTHEVGELNTRLVDDVDQIEYGIGDQVAMFIQYFCAFIAGFIVAFVTGWKLTLVLLSAVPLIAIAGGVMGKLTSSMAEQELLAYAKAGAVAEEVIGSMRTVAAFGGEKKEGERYRNNLGDAKNFGFKKGWISGTGMGMVFFFTYLSYALAFWYGSKLIRDEPWNYTAGRMLTVFFAVMIGSMQLGQAAPHVADFSNARGAAYAVYQYIDMVSKIDSSSEEGLKPEKIRGDIEFRNVHLSYPSRPDVVILNGLNLRVTVGKTVALVGASGCGKSTSVQLLQRFYDPQDGQVLIDGIDLRDWNVKWLRQHIGIVSQEPKLFATTIAENIKYGRADVTMEEMIQAAKEANAHNFIMTLPQKYETMVGERGAQLSGGQKQRIAIARALVRDPKILLLDEATSALDTESESIVQEALDKARLGRTTLVIAHRLSTVRTADYIVGLTGGQIVEQGTHDELMELGQLYYNLVTSQVSAEKKKDIVDEELEEAELIEEFRSSGTFSRNAQSGSRASVRSNRSLKLTSDAEEKEEPEEVIPPISLWKLMRENAPEWPYILIGTIAATVNGCIQPAFAFIFSEILEVYSKPDLDEQRREIDLLSLMFVVIGVVSAITYIVMNGMFARTGELMTMRLRVAVFQAILRQEISYFDDHRNGTGALCSRLASDASLVRGAAGSRVGYILQSLAALLMGLIIGFVYSWKLTLLVLCFAPIVLVAGFVQMKFVYSNKGKDNKMERAATIALETIENIRTVSALTQEENFHAAYIAEVAQVYSEKRRLVHMAGLSYGVSQCVMFFANAACFTFGAYLVQNDNLLYGDMFKVFFAVVFGAMAAGRASSFAPDFGKAKEAGARVFHLLEQVPKIDSSSEAGEKPANFNGSIEFKNVKFHYPTRPNVQVLKGIDLKVDPGQVVALVGSSGCGKSTTVQLIERFYDPIEGSLFFDNCKMDDINLQWLRSQIGIVSQEPILFDCSIRENIAYGDNSREVPMDEIIQAAIGANIHNFIQNLPQGYETSAGDKGTQLSGGQKQRIAIARALVRNPKILLLDEATSALDTESEKVVQEALERAQQGRTSIVIAHRLSTIQNANCIVVFQNGKVMESGTHADLMNKKGFYYKLNTVSQPH